ncbi:MAG TPA: hypothetical protein VN832_03490 [Stellaceae bacterium]|nr:hypothetical protein [Stellaceae bacterium]
MGVIYVARSAKLGDWASEVGLSKHVYKVGCTDEPVKPLVAAGWAGETDWTLIKQQEAPGLSEAEMLARLTRKEKIIDPKYYPRIRGTPGLFKVDPTHVESHILVSRALAGEAERTLIRLKPADFAAYLIHNALR